MSRWGLPVPWEILVQFLIAFLKANAGHRSDFSHGILQDTIFIIFSQVKVSFCQSSKQPKYWMRCKLHGSNCLWLQEMRPFYQHFDSLTAVMVTQLLWQEFLECHLIRSSAVSFMWTAPGRTKAGRNRPKGLKENYIWNALRKGWHYKRWLQFLPVSKLVELLQCFFTRAPFKIKWTAL